MKESDLDSNPAQNSDSIVREQLEPEPDHTDAAVQLNTEAMDEDTKKSQTFAPNRRFNYGMVL